LSLDHPREPAKLHILNQWNASCTDSDGRNEAAKPGEEKMDPKLYLLFALFSSIVAAASYETLREYVQKLRFVRPRKARLPS
jgi:hypothetical protein